MDLRYRLLSTLGLVAVFLALGGPARAAQPDDAARRDYFEKHVRPLLLTHCTDCHSGESDSPGGNLRLDLRAGWEQGGDLGPAIVPGDPDASLLVQAVRYDDDALQMPPDGKLSPTDIAVLERWVADGAFDPRDGKLDRSQYPVEAGDHWAFQPIADPAPPAIEQTEWPHGGLDRFVLAKLEQAGLRPAAGADRRVEIRRVTYGLTGLPPTPAEIEAYLADDQPGAYGRLVDRLLASPAYGERWGRHWLDVVRYADSNGLDENIAHGNAWRYRDYVITAFNDDLPYDQFLQEQLAGDLLDTPEGDDALRRRRLIATGFLSLGPKVLAEVDETKMEMDIIDEQIDTLGRATMGLTLGCARCHDHKFDPVSTKDYYALAGIFKSTRTMEHHTKIARWWENVVDTPERVRQHEKQSKELADLRAEIERLKKADAKANEARVTELQAEAKRLEGELVQLATAMGVTERDTVDVAVHIRGDHRTLGAEVPRNVPAFLQEATQQSQAFPADESGRRELAEWLTSPKHPLTARVMVNRVWRWHFGRGLVDTPSNFGKLGSQPSHPELLDWLAARFIESGWSVKALHRMILTSATYRQTSDGREVDPQGAEVDTENRLLWRAPLRRLEAEQIHDGILAVRGDLNREMGGSLIHVDNRKFFFDHTSKDETRYDVPRRGVYLPVVRNHLYDAFRLFDYSDASVTLGDRPTSTVAPQALYLMNSKFMTDSASRLARAVRRSTADFDGRIDRLFGLTLGRAPTPAERADLRDALAAFGADDATGWDLLCQSVLMSNEFLYLR